MEATKIIYGDQGQPAGMMDGETLFWKDGNPVAFFEDEHIFRLEDGRWVGSVGGGVVYNAFGKPVGFYADHVTLLAPLRPRLSSMLPPRLKPLTGPNISDKPWRQVPAALLGKLEAQKVWMRP
jgi:hypothetical protein